MRPRRQQRRGPTQEELAAGHPQVTAIFLAPTVSAAELEQLQQTEGSPLAIARESLLTGVALDPLLVETSGLKLKRLLDLFASYGGEGWIAEDKELKKDPETKWQVVCPRTLRESITWEAHRQGHTGIDRMTKLVQADWFWLGMTADIRRLVNACEACQAAKHSNPVPNKNRQRLQAGKCYPRT